MTRPRAKPAVAAAVGLAACSLVACGGGQKQKAETPCPTKGKQVTFPLLDKSTPHTVNVLTNLGSKGLGEPPIIPVAAAIANAIRDATGAEIRSLPITREEMLRALREADAREKERSGAAAAV